MTDQLHIQHTGSQLHKEQHSKGWTMLAHFFILAAVFAGTNALTTLAGEWRPRRSSPKAGDILAMVSLNFLSFAAHFVTFENQCMFIDDKIHENLRYM